MSNVQTFNFPIVKDEYGRLTFLWDTGQVLTGFTTIALKLKKPDATEVTFTNASSPAVTLGVADLQDQDGKVHGANKYVTKQVASGDLNQSGTYQLMFIYTDATGVLKTAPAYFYVRPEFDG